MTTSSAPESRDERLRARTRIGVLTLAVITLVGLCGAWWLPERTEWHFLIVTQCIPLCYLGLAWWGTRRAVEPDDV